MRDDVLIENTIYYALEKQPFIGNMMQILQIRYASWLPTAGITYDVKTKSFIMFINKEFFEKLTTIERCAVFFHEIYHVLHKHLVNISQNMYTATPEEKMKWNVSMDLAINQYIEGLPKDAMFPEMFKDKNGKALLLEQPFEYYYDSIDWDKAKKDFGQNSCEKHGTNSSGESGEGKCTCKGKLGPLDEHSLMEEAKSNASEEEMLKAMGDLFRRTAQKTQYGYTNAPKFVQDFLDEIEKRLSKIDYKRILAKCLRKSLPAMDRTGTWYRPSKRFGYQAPGTKDGNIANVEIFQDTSGSISTDELNQANAEIDHVLKNTRTHTFVNLFHTNVYSREKFRRGQKLNSLSLQNGGTDLQDCFDKMKKRKCDLMVVVTDGYYSDIKMDYTPHYNIVFIISKGGTIDHPLKRLGETVQIV